MKYLKFDRVEFIVALSIFVLIFFNNFGIYYYTLLGKMAYVISLITVYTYIYMNYKKIQLESIEVLFFISLFSCFIILDVKYFILNFITTFPAILAMFIISKINSRVTEKLIKLITIFILLGIVCFFIQIVFDFNIIKVMKSNQLDTRVWSCNFFSCMSDNVFRYSFIFEEPGTLASLLCLLITFMPANYKKVRNFYTIVGAMTFSLYFYIYIIIINFCKRINFVKLMILISALLFVFLFMHDILVYVDNKYLNYYVLRRLEFDDGVLVGFLDNRTNYSFISFYNQIPIVDKIIGYHVPISEIYKDWTGLTYRTFIIEYGLISIIIPILFLSVIINKKRGVTTLFVFFVFFVTFFYQRPLFFRAEYLGVFFMLLNFNENSKD